MNEIRAYMTGDAAVQRMFMDLPKTVQDRVVKPLILQGSKILDEAAKTAAPVESGLMKLAIGSSKLKTYGGSTIFITTGVRRGFRRAITAGRGGKLRVRSKSFTESNPNASVRDPVKYLHLVVGGRKALVASSKLLYSATANKFFGKSVAAAKPNPFMERAFDVAKDQVAETILEKAPKMIEAEAQKLAR
jgi:hypothetical protein